VTRLVAASGVALAGCAGAPASADRDVPALIRDPTPESHAELARVVSEWLGGAPVTLAADALADESRLIIERREPRDAQGRPLSGRSYERPERFRLVLRGKRCFLVRESTDERRPIDAPCVPAGR